jgi:NADH:ubiquinone oxidoreductase subunit E
MYVLGKIFMTASLQNASADLKIEFERVPCIELCFGCPVILLATLPRRELRHITKSMRMII